MAAKIERKVNGQIVYRNLSHQNKQIMRESERERERETGLIRTRLWTVTKFETFGSQILISSTTEYEMHGQALRNVYKFVRTNFAVREYLMISFFLFLIETICCDPSFKPSLQEGSDEGPQLVVFKCRINIHYPYL